eukprot:1594240-Rhodomonas_salina.1
MPLALEYERGQYRTLVDDVPDDTDDMVFQYIVVALAIQHGALQSLPSRENALLDPDNCVRNYFCVVQAIAGFGVIQHFKLATLRRV